MIFLLRGTCRLTHTPSLVLPGYCKRLPGGSGNTTTKISVLQAHYPHPTGSPNPRQGNPCASKIQGTWLSFSFSRCFLPIDPPMHGSDFTFKINSNAARAFTSSWIFYQFEEEKRFLGMTVQLQSWSPALLTAA